MSNELGPARRYRCVPPRRSVAIRKGYIIRLILLDSDYLVTYTRSAEYPEISISTPTHLHVTLSEGHVQ